MTLSVTPVPCLSDNYAWLLRDEASGAVALCDPSEAGPPLRAVEALGVVAGLFVLAGATPAALGLLADISERYPDDRGAIMGLYSVFFGLGQFIGQLLGGHFGDWQGVDGVLILTLLLGVISLITLLRLHGVEPARAPAAMATE
jgi:predicted MFS family arabinose efflux permease